MTGEERKKEKFITMPAAQVNGLPFLWYDKCSREIPAAKKRFAAGHLPLIRAERKVSGPTGSRKGKKEFLSGRRYRMEERKPGFTMDQQKTGQFCTATGGVPLPLPFWFKGMERKRKICGAVWVLSAFLLCSCGEKEPVTETVPEAAATEEAPVTESGTEEQKIVIVSETEEATEEETTVDYAALVTGTMYVMGDSVNIRKDASADSEKAGSLSAGDEVSVIESRDGWTSIYYKEGICYVKTDFLTEDRDWREHLLTKNGYADGESVTLNDSWEYADFSEVRSGAATMYVAKTNRKGIVVGVNAGHGTSGSYNYYTWCHPDKTPKVTGGTTAAGSEKAVSVSSGMNFSDGTPEAKITLKEALIVKELLLQNGYDVLMIRESDDVQLDNVARTVICNNAADCHIAIHWDGDGLSYDKGCFYMSVPDGIKYLPSVAGTWQESERLGGSLIRGLEETGNKIMGEGCMDMDLTQTSFSTVPSVDIELGNQSSDHGEEKLYQLAEGLVKGIDLFFGKE